MTAYKTFVDCKEISNYNYTILYDSVIPILNIKKVLDKIEYSNFYIYSSSFLVVRDIQNFPYNLVAEKAKEAKLKNLKFYYIVECCAEAPGWYYDFSKIQNHFDEICRICDITYDNIITMSGAHDDNNHLITHCINLTQFGIGPEISSADKSIVKKIPTHLFVSLSHVPRAHRLIATEQIWDRKLDKFGYVSMHLFPDEINHNNTSNLIRFNFCQKFKDRLPACVGKYANGPIQFELRNQETAGAFVHIVQESTIEETICDWCWHYVFYTEKTLKPFAWGQVPIFITMPGHIKLLRELGYDLFDDLIDHNYDNELDPFKRITMAIDQLEKLSQLPFENLQEYKVVNMQRFIDNRKKSENQHKRNIMISINNLRTILSRQVIS